MASGTVVGVAILLAFAVLAWADYKNLLGWKTRLITSEVRFARLAPLRQLRIALRSGRPLEDEQAVVQRRLEQDKPGGVVAFGIFCVLLAIALSAGSLLA